MTVQVVGILLAILFAGVGWLHYRVNKLHDKASKAHSLSTMTYLMILGLSEILIKKGLVSEEDIAGPPKSTI